MKIFNILISIFLAANVNFAYSQTYSSQHEQAKQHFSGKKEPRSQGAYWTAEKEFKVGVMDDGTKRDGYAQYVCEILYDYGFKGKGIRVQIIDAPKLTVTKKLVRLGNAYCI